MATSTHEQLREIDILAKINLLSIENQELRVEIVELKGYVDLSSTLAAKYIVRASEAADIIHAYRNGNALVDEQEVEQAAADWLKRAGYE